MPFYRCLLTALLAVVVIAVRPPSVLAQGSWQDHRQLEAARSHLGAAVLNNEIYVAGGAGLLGPLDVFEVFDPVSDYWIPLPSMPNGREQFGMVAAAGRIFIAGGFTAQADNGPSKEVWSFNPDIQSWQPEPDMPAGRACHAMAAVGDRIFVLGGRGSQAQDILVFDAAARKWQSAAVKMPAVRSAMSATVIGTKIYLVGGITAEGQASARVDIYDSQSGSWSRAPDLPSARSAPVSGALGGDLHVAGGATQNPRATHAEHYVLKAGQSSWQKASALPTPRYAGAGVTAGSRWYVLGGGVGSGVLVLFTAVDAVESFGP